MTLQIIHDYPKTTSLSTTLTFPVSETNSPVISVMHFDGMDTC